MLDRFPAIRISLDHVCTHQILNAVSCGRHEPENLCVAGTCTRGDSVAQNKELLGAGRLAADIPLESSLASQPGITSATQYEDSRSSPPIAHHHVHSSGADSTSVAPGHAHAPSRPHTSASMQVAQGVLDANSLGTGTDRTVPSHMIRYSIAQLLEVKSHSPHQAPHDLAAVSAEFPSLFRRCL
jgi:hypothetical protein